MNVVTVICLSICFFVLSNCCTYGQNSLGTKDLADIARHVDGLSRKSAEPQLDLYVSELSRRYKKSNDPKVLEVLFKVGCKFQFVDSEKADLVFRKIIVESNDFVLKGICSYQLGLANYGKPEAAHDYELAIKYLAEVDESEQYLYSSMLGNCYGHAGSLFANAGNYRQAQKTYADFFSHDELCYRVNPVLAVRYATSLTRLSKRLGDERDQGLTDVSAEIISRVIGKRNHKLALKLVDPSISLLRALVLAGERFDKLVELKERISSLIRLTGDDDLLLGFVVEWQVVAFFEYVGMEDSAAMVEVEVAKTSKEILHLTESKKRSDRNSVLEQQEGSIDRIRCINVQAILIDATCKKMNRKESSSLFDQVRNQVRVKSSWTFQPHVPKYGIAKGWNIALDKIFKVVERSEEESCDFAHLLKQTGSSKERRIKLTEIPEATHPSPGQHAIPTKAIPPTRDNN